MPCSSSTRSTSAPRRRRRSISPESAARRGTRTSAAASSSSWRSLTVERMVYVGGYTQESLDMWAMTVPEQPMPIEAEFEPLHRLLSLVFMPDLDRAALRRTARGSAKPPSSTCRATAPTRGPSWCSRATSWSWSCRAAGRAGCSQRPGRDGPHRDQGAGRRAAGDAVAAGREPRERRRGGRSGRRADPHREPRVRPLARRAGRIGRGVRPGRRASRGARRRSAGGVGLWAPLLVAARERSRIADGDLLTLRVSNPRRRMTEGCLLGEPDVEEAAQRV